MRNSQNIFNLSTFRFILIKHYKNGQVIIYHVVIFYFIMHLKLDLCKNENIKN